MHVTDPSQTGRAAAFSLWMAAPMPMVTLFKTLDVTVPVRLCKKGRYRLNALLCWCVGKAATGVEEFYLLPVGSQLMRYDRLAVSTVVDLGGGEIATCDIPFSPDPARFHQDYLDLTRRVQSGRRPNDLSGSHMVVGTSALPQCEIDGAVNLYAGLYNNPFLIWGRYRQGLRRASLPISFQFHHVQMDGGHAARFLNGLQREIDSLRL